MCVKSFSDPEPALQNTVPIRKRANSMQIHALPAHCQLKLFFQYSKGFRVLKKKKIENVIKFNSSYQGKVMQLWDRHSICSPSLKMLLSIKTFQPKRYISIRTGTKQGYGSGKEPHSSRIRIFIQVFEFCKKIGENLLKNDILQHFKKYFWKSNFHVSSSKYFKIIQKSQDPNFQVNAGSVSV